MCPWLLLYVGVCVYRLCMLSVCMYGVCMLCVCLVCVCGLVVVACICMRVYGRAYMFAPTDECALLAYISPEPYIVCVCTSCLPPAMPLPTSSSYADG